MKDVIGKSLVVLTSCVFLLSASCVKATAPKCDDSRVTESVLEITKKVEIQAKSKPFDEAIALLKNLKYDPNNPMTFPDLELYCSKDVLQGATYEDNVKACIADKEARKSKTIAFIKALKMGIKDIRTTSVNDKTGKQVCACNITITDEQGTNVFPMTYTSELSDGGKNFYVNITSGL
jgi:hypothetical protein